MRLLFRERSKFQRSCRKRVGRAARECLGIASLHVFCGEMLDAIAELRVQTAVVYR